MGDDFRMPANKRWCEQCGTPLPADARFCEMCGTPAGAVHLEQAEMVIGHLPAARIEEGKRLFGRAKTTQLNLVITTSCLLCLRETNEMNENWLAEQERLLEEEKRSGLPWRALIDNYNWRNPLWARFYNTPPGELLAAHRGNETIPLADVVSASVTLEEELDKLDILLTSGEMHHFLLFNQVGQAAARFLAQALGPERLRLTPLRL
jgi:hypothetical protein